MDIFINKLTLSGTQQDLDLFLREQVVDNRMSFSSIIPMPQDLAPVFNDYETEFIHSDFDNALIFKRTDSGFLYKHVNANIYPFYNDNETHAWVTDNWQTSYDINDQDLFISQFDDKLEISFSTRYSYPFIWFYELSKKYSGLECSMEVMAYDYKYIKLTVTDEGINFDRETMPYFYQFDGMGLVEDNTINVMEAMGNG